MREHGFDAWGSRQKPDAAGDKVPKLDDGPGDRVRCGRHDPKLSQIAQDQQREQAEKTDESGCTYLQAADGLFRCQDWGHCRRRDRLAGGKADLCPGRAVLYRTGSRFQYMRLDGRCRLSGLFIMADKIGAEEVARK